MCVIRQKLTPSLEYDSRYISILGRYFKETEENYILQYLDLLGDKILELGCGTGRLILSLSKSANLLIELDLSLTDLKIAKCKAGEKQRKVLVICGDGKNLPLKDSLITGVIALGTFEYVKVLEPFLNELKRTVKHDGYLLFSCWNKDRLLNLSIFRLDNRAAEFTIEEISSILEKSDWELIDYKTTFFMPRKLFWGLYKILPFSYLKKLFVFLSLWVEKIFVKIPSLKGKGWELLILARLNY